MKADMKLNYHAFPRRGDNFAFHAKDDEEAKALVLEYMREAGDVHETTIYRWCPEKKKWAFDDKTSIVVEIKQPKVRQEKEFKLTTTYVKYVNVKGVMTEDEFHRAAQEAVDKLLELPNHPGWEVSRERAEPTFCSDDDRYRFKGKIDTIEL